MILAEGSHDPDRPVGELELSSSSAERRRVLEDWNATAAPYPARCLHQLIAGSRPVSCSIAVAEAVDHDGERLTYAELDGRANRLANRLRALGVGRDMLVGVCVERSTRPAGRACSAS